MDSCLVDSWVSKLVGHIRTCEGFFVLFIKIIIILLFWGNAVEKQENVPCYKHAFLSFAMVSGHICRLGEIACFPALQTYCKLHHEIFKLCFTEWWGYTWIVRANGVVGDIPLFHINSKYYQIFSWFCTPLIPALHSFSWSQEAAAFSKIERCVIWKPQLSFSVSSIPCFHEIYTQL